MFCTKCGTKIENNVMFCTTCGNKLNYEEYLQPEQELKQEPEQELKQEPEQELKQEPGQELEQESPQELEQESQQELEQESEQQIEKCQEQPKPQQSRVDSSLLSGKGINTKAVILALEVVVLLIAVIGIYRYGKKLTDPQLMAEQYFAAEYYGDVGMMYNMMEPFYNEIIDYEQFTTVACQSELLRAPDYEVTKSKRLSEIAESYLEEENPDAVIESFKCIYETDGQGTTNVEQIDLVKQTAKKWIFFDEWRVIPSNFLN